MGRRSSAIRGTEAPQHVVMDSAQSAFFTMWVSKMKRVYFARQTKSILTFSFFFVRLTYTGRMQKLAIMKEFVEEATMPDMQL